MKQIRWSIPFLALVLLAALVACGGGAPSSPVPTAGATLAPGVAQTAQATPAATTGPSANGKTNVQLLGWASSNAEDSLLKQMLTDYNNSQSQYNASFNPVPNYDQSLQTALAGGTPPDVFYLDSLKLPDFIKNGVLATPPANAISNPSDFYPSLAAAFTNSGTLYCPPKDFSTLGLVYNKQMLDAAGVKVPTTWDELKAAAQKLTDKSKGVYGMVLSMDAARWGAFLYQAGGHVLSNGKMDINTPAAKTAMDFYTGLITSGYATTPDKVDSGWPGEAFGKQKAAMVVEGNWIVPFLQQSYPNVQWAVAELPTGPAGKATLAFTVCYAVPKSAKNPTASWNLVNALTDSAGMQKWTDLGLAMPTRKSLRDHWASKFPNLQPFLAGADYSHPWEFAPGFSAVVDAINNGMQKIVAGQATSSSVLQDVQRTGEQTLSP